MVFQIDRSSESVNTIANDSALDFEIHATNRVHDHDRDNATMVTDHSLTTMKNELEQKIGQPISETQCLGGAISPALFARLGMKLLFPPATSFSRPEETIALEVKSPFLQLIKSAHATITSPKDPCLAWDRATRGTAL